MSKKKVLAPFQCFMPISMFYAYFSVLSPFQHFMPISAFYAHFSVLCPFQRFILILAFYPQCSVLSPFQRLIQISAFYFRFCFQFVFQPFSFSVLFRPLLQQIALIICIKQSFRIRCSCLYLRRYHDLIRCPVTLGCLYYDITLEIDI